MAPLLDERSRRRWAASEARMIGHGGVSAVAEATGLARRTIYRGLEDLQDRASVGNDRIRRQGGGRKSRITEDPTLLSDLKSLLEPATRGDPMRRQLWTSRSLRKLCVELKGKGHEISYPVVGDCLHKLHYSLQANRKSHEGSEHMDRNGQFEYINKKAGSFLTDGRMASRSSRSIRKRRSWSAISRMRAANGDPKARPKRSMYMTSLIPS